MIIRFVIIAAVISIGCKLIFGRWPWQFAGAKSTRQQALFRARKLLGVSSKASRQEVLEAHKRLIAMVHPDRGGTNSQVHEANAARDLLINELPHQN
jgi:DnaJ family protein C protein 19